MPTPNYAFEKRQRELAKKKKQDEKDARKRDLLARIWGPEPVDPAAISAGLRYNLDLILGTSPAPAR